MAFTVAHDDMRTALAALRPLVKRSPIPLIECALLEFGNGRCVVNGTDLGIWLRMEVASAGDGVARVAVPFERLHRLFGADRGGDAVFVAAEKTVEIKRGRMRTVLPVLDTDGWPEIGDALPDGGCEIARAEIARVIAFCGDAAERNSAFPELEGIFFDSEGEKPCAVGSNSRIVAWTDLSTLSGSIPKMTRAVPKDAVQLALSACGDGEMSFRSDDERVEFAWALGRLRSKIPDAPFLAWRRLLDIYATRAEVVCQTDALSAAVTRVIAGSGGTMLGFAAADGVLAIRGREKVTDPDAIDEIECEYSSDPLMFGLNATWTANALSAAKGSDKVTLAIMGREDDRAAVVNFISDTGQWFVAQLAPRFYPEIAQRRAA